MKTIAKLEEIMQISFLTYSMPDEKRFPFSSDENENLLKIDFLPIFSIFSFQHKITKKIPQAQSLIILLRKTCKKFDRNSLKV